MALENLLLLSCRSPFLDDAKIYTPMANLYLKTFVERETDVNVTLGDDNYKLYNLDLDNYDAVGISIMTPQRNQADELARSIKTQYPNMKIIAGGPHVKHYLSMIEQNLDYDHLVPLDGEKSLVRIINGETDRKVVDVMSKKDILTAPRPDRYSTNAIDLIEQYSYTLGDREATTMMTGRGCPEMCTFCEDAQTGVKWSSLDNLKLEMDDIVNLGFRGVYIFDDLFAIAKPKVEPIAKELYKRDLIYRCNAQARYFTQWGKDMANLLADTGCYEIAFGAESGSQLILDNIKKRCTVEQNYQTVEYAKEAGIIVKAFMLLGLPGETQETLDATEDFIKNSGIDDFQCAVYYPFKGTQIREDMDAGRDVDLSFKKEGLGAYGQKGGKTESIVGTKELSPRQLEAFRDYLVEKYRPESHGKFFEVAHVQES